MFDGISVIIPTKNRAELLRQTLRSVAMQSLPAANVIVADDGSTDDTENVVRAFGARHLVNASGDWGAAAARNAGLELAQTPYVAFIDFDDIYHPRALERLHDALDGRKDAPFSFGRGLAAHQGASGWESDGLIAPSRAEIDDFLCSLYARNMIPSAGALVRRDLALGVGGYDRETEFIEDHAFWLKLARLGQPVYVPHVVCLHRVHRGNRMSPMIAASDIRLLSDVTAEDERLAVCVPRRLGVQLCELTIDAVQQRSLPGLWIAAQQLLHGRRRLEILRHVAVQPRARRTCGRVGGAMLASDDQLRDWLAQYH